MKKLLWDKIKEALFSVLPVTLIVIILNFTPLVNLTLSQVLIFSVSAVFLILGIGFFTLGADIAMTPMGEHVGSGLTKSKNLKLFCLFALPWVFLLPLQSRICLFWRGRLAVSSLLFLLGLAWVCF